MENQIITINNPRGEVDRIFDRLDVNENTRKEYKYRIGMFLDFGENQGFNRNSFREFKNMLKTRVDYKVSTKSKYLETARIFLKELAFLNPGMGDITLNTKGFEQNKKHRVEGVNDEEMDLLTLYVGELTNDSQNDRLKAILSLLIFQGLRQIEVVRLDVLDIDFVAKVALVQGKGRDDKEPINLHPEAVKALQNYIKSNKAADGALFVSQSNNSKNKRLSTRAVRGIIKEIFDSLEISKTTHGLRHYFTTTLIKTYKGELLEVSKYTRHRGIEMLQVYNDNINRQADLPRFYGAFDKVKL